MKPLDPETMKIIESAPRRSIMEQREALDQEWLDVSRQLWDEHTSSARYWDLRERQQEIEAEMDEMDQPRQSDPDFERAAFECWAKTQRYDLTREPADGDPEDWDYRFATPRIAWQAWQARASLPPVRSAE